MPSFAVKMSFKVFCIVILLECVIGAKLPDYIKTCKRNPDFNKCATENGRLAIPHLLKGDKAFKVPVLVPLRIPKVELQAGQGLNLKVNDATVYGVDTVNLKELKVDFNKHTVQANLFFDFLNIVGQYEVDGRLLIRLQGKGPLNITISNVRVIYDIDYNIVQKNGEDYVDIAKDNLFLKSEKQHYHLDNLFGNKQLSDETNRVLNENAADIGKELNGPVTEIIKAIVTELIKNYMTTVPISTLFPAK